MTRSLSMRGLGVLLALMAPSAVGGQGFFAARHAEALGQNPPGVHFTVRLKDGRAQFHPGETIRIELAGSSDLPKTYLWSSQSYDRSGRLAIDRFDLEPTEGVADPLRDYFASQIAMMGGGLSGVAVLGEKPETITLELNEWFRFDRPGRYRLFVVTRRISRERQATEPGEGDVNLPTASNIIEFQILKPNADWSAQEYVRAVQTLDQGRPSEDYAPDSNRRGACRTLRFLGTEAAAIELARRLSSEDRECNFEYMAGTFGSPHRARIIRELKARLDDPNTPVSTGLLWTLTQLVFLERSGPWPAYPRNDRSREAEWQRMFKERNEARQALYWQYGERLASLLRGKQGRARTVSLHAALEIALSQASVQKTPEVSVRAESLWADVAGSFSELPPQEQYSMLSARWKQLRKSGITSVLRRIYEDPPGTIQGFRDLALHRLHEIDPTEGRRIILAEIRSPEPRVGIAVLGMLPEGTLPALDGTLAENLEKNLEGGFEALARIAELIERYATEAILERVQNAYGDNGGRWACAVQAPLLAYFLRVKPSYGLKQVRHALGARGEGYSRCYEKLFTEVATFHAPAELVELAREFLDDRNPEVTADAASMLGKYGPAEVQESLWKKLKKWHEVWKDRTAELRHSWIRPSENLEQWRLESALWHALAYASGWTLTSEEWQRLNQLCVTASCKRETEALQKSSQGALPLGYFDLVPARRWRVAHYELGSLAAAQRKLEQFPAGTTFFWQLGDETDPERRQIFEELRAFATARGLVVNDRPPSR